MIKRMDEAQELSAQLHLRGTLMTRKIGLAVVTLLVSSVASLAADLPRL